MASSDKYSLWLRPHGDIAFSIQQRINKLSDKYGTPSFEPHVTLLSGIRYGETELIQLTETLAGALSPFDLLLTKAGYRDKFYQSLFVHIKKSSELMNAYNTALQLFGYEADEDFIPHLSLMYGDISREEKERILSIMGREFHIRFEVHNLLLVNTEGKPDEWKKIHLAEFKS
ncbi:MAG TPA: 2'-5' RNA ligase family protein [Halalkalibaculum sp.]|nr:2'-5' RNA ligase family protein [Halalkalibaculum sp.]